MVYSNVLQKLGILGKTDTYQHKELRETPLHLFNIIISVIMVIIAIIIITAGPAQAPGGTPPSRASVAAPGLSAASSHLWPAAGRTAAAKTCRWRSGPTTGWKTAEAGSARSAAEAQRRRCCCLSMHATCLARLRRQRLGGSDSRAHARAGVRCV